MAPDDKSKDYEPRDLAELVKMFRDEYNKDTRTEQSKNKFLANMKDTWFLFEIGYTLHESQKELNKLTKELKESSDKLNNYTILLAILTGILVLDIILKAFNML